MNDRVVRVDPLAGTDIEIPDPFTRTTDENGWLHGLSPRLKVTVIPDDAPARMFNRAALQPFKGRGKKVLVCELGGVRLYIDGDHLVLTKRKLNPSFNDGNPG